MTPPPTSPSPSTADPTSLFRLDGKVALVTGGSRGLGREMVKAFAAVGADVVIASRKKEACRELADEVERETGQRALAVGCHVGNWDECDALAKRALDHFGRVDILVNNAGMSPLYSDITEVSEALYDKVMDVNLKGAFRLTAVLGRSMMNAEGGSIIGVSSVAAAQPSPAEIPYGAAKAGLHNLVKSFARAFAPKVRVNCIMPGAFMTDISKAWPEAAIDQINRTTPLGRGGAPDEIVGAALYLASDASRYTTGTILKVDGGAVYSNA
ncbi:MAG TPA: SDR family oxidoreductase [Myxococcales bacterium]|nr:SDR family oxidoreductase [Myxococcales bacterium]HIL80234.1 SDR family oxidoreductase [Myxococcales bacterium]